MRFPALHSRSFRLYEGASLFALSGHWITRIVAGWLSWELTGSATWVGLISFFLFAPAIVTGPFFGVLMDRARLRRAAIISHGIITAATLVLFVLYVSDVLTIWNLSVVTLVIGVAASAERSVRMTIVPRMVDIYALPNAVAIHATNFNVQRLIGPAIGGLMIDRFGTGTTILVNFVILIPFLIALFFLSVREKDNADEARPRFLAEFWGGAKHAAVHTVIREAMILTCVTSVTVRGVLEILPAIADGVFHRGAEGLGQMVAAGGGGALLASVIIALRQARQWGSGIPLIGYLAVFLGVSAVTALGVADTWTLAMLTVAVCGFSGTMIGINMQSTIQLTVDDAYRGRVMSLWMMTGIGTSALGALTLGTAADIFGLSQTLIGGGIASAVVVIAVRVAHWRAAGRSSRPPAADSERIAPS